MKSYRSAARSRSTSEPFVQSGDLISTTLSPGMIWSLSREQSGAR